MADNRTSSTLPPSARGACHLTATRHAGELLSRPNQQIAPGCRDRSIRLEGRVVAAVLHHAMGWQPGWGRDIKSLSDDALPEARVPSFRSITTRLYAASAGLLGLRGRAAAPGPGAIIEGRPHARLTHAGACQGWLPSLPTTWLRAGGQPSLPVRSDMATDQDGRCMAKRRHNAPLQPDPRAQWSTRPCDSAGLTCCAT